VVACFLIVDTLNTFGTIILRIDVRAFVSSIHSIILIACKAGLALLFVIRYDLGVLGYWLGFLIGECIGLMIMIWLVRKRIVFKFTWNRVWDLLKFGLPLMPAMLSTTILKLANRYMIGFMVGLDQAAIYDVGYKVGSIILLIIMPFRAAWTPFSFSIAKKPEAARIYRDVLTYLIAGCSFLVLGVYAFRYELVRIMAPVSYRSAADVVGWVAVSQLFFIVYLVFSVGPMIKNKTHHLAWIAMCASGLNLFLNFILIPSMGILGAAVATFAGYGLLGVLTYFTARRSFDMQIDWSRMKRLGVAILIVTFMILAAEQLELSIWMEIGMKVFGLVAFPVLLLMTKFVNPTQTKELLNLGRNLMGKKFATKRA
jgi:O-antigen/teichoic acid export membrane protein